MERREQGRQRILDGAALILDAGALGDFTVDSLARNLHMSKSTLYKYFESKDHVVVALVEAACNQTRRSLEALDSVSHRTAVDALDRLTDVLADHSDRIPAAILLARDALPPDAMGPVLGLRAAVRSRIQAILARGRASGELSVPDPALAATAYQAALEEVIMDAARGVGDLTRGDALRAVHQMIAHGIATPRA